MFESIPTSYPLYFNSNVSRLAGSMSKSMLKINSDRTDATPSTLTSIRLPIGSLLNLESLNIQFKVTTTGSEVTVPTRYSSSFIKRMAVTINNTTVTVINDYALLYNIYADHTNKDKTKGIGGEMLDNSILYSEAAGTGTGDQAITAVSSLMAATANRTYDMNINNFIGLFGSASSSIISTSKMGEVVISLEWAPAAEVLGGVGKATSVAAGGYSGSSYTVSDINVLCEALSFSDTAYYSAVENADDIKIAFDDFVVNKFASCTKTAGINVSSYVSTGSLEHVMGTCLLASAPTQQLVAMGANGTGATEGVVTNISKYLGDPVAYTAEEDAFFSVKALQRQLQHVKTSQFSINNKQLNFGSLNRQEIFANNLHCLGYMNTDSSSNGFNPTILSLEHYYKYYGAAFQSLSLLDREKYYISGLSSAGSSAAINWVCDFTGASTMAVTPVLIFKLQKVLHIGAGRSIFVE